MNLDARLRWPFLVVPSLLVLIYGMLSYISLADQSFFYESMEIPVPENEFLLWSWGGKNSAMLAVLVLGIASRRALPVLIAMAMLLVGQFGDINAGAQSGVNVFITYIALALVLVQLGLLFFGGALRDADD